METKHIAPAWARIFIVPAIILFILSGLGLAAVGFYLSIDQHSIDGILPIAFGIFLVIVGWEGRWLFTSRNVMACLKDDILYYSHSPSSNVRMISILDVVIVDMPWLKMAYLDQKSSRQRLMSIDYWYKNGLSLFRDIQKRQSEQQIGQVSSEATISDEPST